MRDRSEYIANLYLAKTRATRADKSAAIRANQAQETREAFQGVIAHCAAILCVLGAILASLH